MLTDIFQFRDHGSIFPDAQQETNISNSAQSVVKFYLLDISGSICGIFVSKKNICMNIIIPNCWITKLIENAFMVKKCINSMLPVLSSLTYIYLLFPLASLQLVSFGRRKLQPIFGSVALQLRQEPPKAFQGFR